MRYAKKGLQTILLVLLIAALAYITGSNYLSQRRQSPPEPTPELSAQTPEASTPTPAPAAETPVPEPTPDAQPEPSPEPTPSGETVRALLAFGGELVMHDGLNAEAKGDGGYDYAALLSGAAEELRKADYAAVTLETTFPGGEEYSGYPLRRSPDALAESLKALGVDLVNTGTNHALDSGEEGLVRTLDVLDENGLAHVGACRTQAERESGGAVTAVEVNGIRIAFLSFVYGTDAETEDCPWALSLLYDGGAPDYGRVDAEMAAARESGADAIVVFLHWGEKNRTEPDAAQQTLADHLFEQGADVLIGGHPHVPQPMEQRQATGPDGREKTVFLCYSLGNLVSCQTDLYTNLTALLNIELEKDLGSGRTVIRSVRYVPMFMMNRTDYGVKGEGWRYRLLDLYSALEAYENGEAEDLNEAMYKSLQEGLEDIHRIFGAELDARE